MAYIKKADRLTTEAVAIVEAEVAPTPMMRDRSEITSNRPKRVPIHEQRDQLSTNQKQGFVRRWVNDVPGRVEKFIKAGYAVVTDKDVVVGDENSNMALGTGARKNVGRTRQGEGTQGILMEIPKDYYDEDQKAKAKLVDASEQAMKRGKDENDFYGDIQQSSSFARKKASFEDSKQ
jgi:hypothetical protein